MRQVKDAELAQAWVQCRRQVLGAIAHSFPAAGSLAVETAVDQAWSELYERNQTEEQAGARAPDGLPARLSRLAYLRALNGVRERRRHPLSTIPVEELAENGALGGRGSTTGMEGLRAEARVQEIVGQVSGEGRVWLQAIMDDPSAPPREIARTLGWDREKLKSVSRRTRAGLREFVLARESGVIRERRQATMGAFAATRLARLDPAYAARFAGLAMLGLERYEQTALHIAGCEECERAWRRAQARLLRPQLAVFPFGFAGKLAAAGASGIARGRRMLDRLLGDLRLRVGSSVGRASAGGAAGTAGTAGALAGKGAAVCVGVLCAAGAGTAALVGGLPAAVIAPHTVRHHGTIAAHSSQISNRPASTTATLATSAGQGLGAQTATSDARAGLTDRRASAARALGKPVGPATPGDLIASSAGSSGKPESGANASIATVASTRTASQTTSTSTSYTPSATTKATRTGGSACVPGSLSC
jgi:hypothetical protein